MHEDLDLWEIVHAYIFGETEDENTGEDSKSDNPAERDSNGHTYKATKRKLMSVEDIDHEHNHYDSSHTHGKPHSHYSNPQVAHSKSSQSQGQVQDEDQSDADVEVEEEEDDLESDSVENPGFSALFWDFISKIADAWGA